MLLTNLEGTAWAEGMSGITNS